MDFESVIFEQKESVAVIRMNHPKELNTLSMSLVSDLLKALELCWDDGGIKAVLSSSREAAGHSVQAAMR